MSNSNANDWTPTRQESEALSQLLRRCERRLFLWAEHLMRNLQCRGIELSQRVEAEDIVQEAYCVAYKRGRELLALSPPGAMAWLRSAVENCLNDERRRQGAKKRNPLQEVDLTAFETPSGCDFQLENERQLTPSAEMEHSETLREFASIIASLPDGAREAFVLVKIGGLTIDRAAERLAISPNAVCLGVGRASAAIVKAVKRRPHLFPYLSDVVPAEPGASEPL